MPATPDELSLHERVLSGDESASGEVFARYLNWLTDVLEAKNPGITKADETLVLDAISDGLLDYTTHPERYDPAGKSLKNYLYMAACGDLLNAWKKRTDQFGRENNVEDIEDLSRQPTENSVGFPEVARNQPVEAHNATGTMSDPQKMADLSDGGDLWVQVQSLVPDRVELRVLALMTWGVRDVGPYAAIMNIDDKPLHEQRLLVNKVKEKLKRRLQRRLNVKRLGYEFE